jgi:hypothetical protein
VFFENVAEILQRITHVGVLPVCDRVTRSDMVVCMRAVVAWRSFRGIWAALLLGKSSVFEKRGVKIAERRKTFTSLSLSLHSIRCY